MNKEIKFLEYLRKTNSDVVAVNVDEKLKEIDVTLPGYIVDFLGSLKQRGYIDYANLRETISDNQGGFIAAPNSEDTYVAGITFAGKEYLQEQKLKQKTSFYTASSFVVAGFAFGFSVFQWYLSIKKEDASKQDYTVLSSRVDSLVRKMNAKPVPPTVESRADSAIIRKRH